MREKGLFGVKGSGVFGISKGSLSRVGLRVQAVMVLRSGMRVLGSGLRDVSYMSYSLNS